MMRIVSTALITLCLASTAFAQAAIEPQAHAARETGSPERADTYAEQPGSAVGGFEGGGYDKPLSLGILVGYGASLEDGPNPWGVGLGVRGGFNLDALFLGIRFVYYLGESDEWFGNEVSLNVWELGAEVGYDISLVPMVSHRPGLGLGIASLTVDFDTVVPGVEGDDSQAKPYVAPGVGLYVEPSDFFVGAEVRFKLVFGIEEPDGDETTFKALTFLANAGLRF